MNLLVPAPTKRELFDRSQTVCAAGGDGTELRAVRASGLRCASLPSHQWLAMKILFGLVFALLLVAICVDAVAADSAIARDFPPGLQIPPQAQPGPDFDVDKATVAWLGL